MAIEFDNRPGITKRTMGFKHQAERPHRLVVTALPGAGPGLRPEAVDDDVSRQPMAGRGEEQEEQRPRGAARPLIDGQLAVIDDEPDRAEQVGA